MSEADEVKANAEYFANLFTRQEHDNLLTDLNTMVTTAEFAAEAVGGELEPALRDRDALAADIFRDFRAEFPVEFSQDVVKACIVMTRELLSLFADDVSFGKTVIMLMVADKMYEMLADEWGYDEIGEGNGAADSS